MNDLLLRTSLDDRQRHFVQACNASGKLLVQLINDILDLSKIEAGKLELDLRPCSIEALVFEAVEILLHMAEQKGLTLTCRLAPDACVMAVCDDNRIRQILVNLLANAIKFTSTGGITLACDRLTQPEGGDRLRIAVIDTGVGIPTERKDRLFKPFSQIDSSMTRRYGGTGLGLSICRQLVELMGGAIGVESQVGSGSTFWFEIPLEIVSDSAPAWPPQSLVGTRIIVVDGLDRERQQIRECLVQWGCLFKQVATMQQAVESVSRAHVQSAPFQVMLADCRLAEGGEYVSLQKLAQDAGLCVICLGVPPDDVSKKSFDSLGVRHYLRDPVRPSALLDAIRSAMALTSDKRFPRAIDKVPVANPPPARLTGHILVAEDNRINQLYIVELLKHFGCTSDVVENGEEALAAIERKSYDMILMDCQMPEMDGFTATRCIRQREASQPKPRPIPIVALTANALKGDRERCLEAGMNDYITKPVDGDQLQSLLQRTLHGKPAAS